ncbi:MAG: adenylate/guanylate cyclase domain-containing protein [Ignavibacteriales bacterium]|nr:adenylate/guanylate cyclase domain-containing protein [Ignavibacteriales bacterium]
MRNCFFCFKLFLHFSIFSPQFLQTKKTYVNIGTNDDTSEYLQDNLLSSFGTFSKKESSSKIGNSIVAISYLKFAHNSFVKKTNSPPILLSKKVLLKVPRDVLWSFLADTDRLNRTIDLPAIKFIPYPDPRKKGHYQAEAKKFGVRVSYEEFPFDYVAGRHYKVLRRFKFGFLQDIIGGIRLVPKGDATELEVFGEVMPHNILSRIVALTYVRKVALKDVLNITKAFEKHFLNPREQKLPTLPPKELLNPNQFESRNKDLKKYFENKNLISKLEKHLLTASDLEVVRMRPFELADKWSEDRYEVLKLFLYSTKVGLLDLHWTILCPNCRAVSSDNLTLKQLQAESHCDTCEIKFGSDFSSSVETRFTVHPAVRIARNEMYCIGGPANMPEIIAQLRLESNEKRVEEMEVKNGILRVRCYQTEEMFSVQVKETTNETTLKIKIENGKLIIDNTEVKTGTIRLEVYNNSNDESLVVLERETWKENAATAAIVTSLQGFRDTFPEEAVAPGEELGISSIVILFTDLKGSTQMYQAIGDAKAFSFVENHFHYLTEFVSKYHGGIVKTMGDAIMATFTKSIDALQAALEMQQQWKKFYKEYGSDLDVLVRIGIHAGSAIAINNRGKLDCFGATVNMAARLEKYSNGNDVIISDAIKNDSEVVEFISKNNCDTESFETSLKGFDEEKFLLWKVKTS